MDEVHARLLRELDLYISFFRRRQDIEHDYVEALKKLSRGSERITEDVADAQVSTTWRSAFAAVRNAVEDEARAHRSTAEGLERLLVRLTAFRDDRDRIRRRIKEDLRSTASVHTDYKGVVQRLRRTYERKVEELQHYEEAEAARLEADTSGLTTSSSSGTRTPIVGATPNVGVDKNDVAWPPEHWTATEPASRMRSNSGASSRVASGNGSSASDAESPPISAISPTLSPVFVSGATSSSAVPTSAYRDPPSAKSSVFDAIAKRDWSGDKQRVNSIVRAVGSLGKSGEHSSAPRNARSRQYGGRLKREAEQADRDYRAGIFQLETLRLQKSRVQSSAKESLHELVVELSSTLKSTLTKNISEQALLGEAHVAIASHVQPDIERIEPLQDAEAICTSSEEPLTDDEPVYYVNAFVGECKSLLFGVGLQDYHAKHPDVLVPLIVQRCIAYVETHGLDYEGIYRISGKLSTIQHIVHRMEKEEEAFKFGQADDVSAVAGVLKLYLRQLPTPLFPFSQNDRRAFTAEYATMRDIALRNLDRRIRRLPAAQQATLQALCRHLAQVAKYERVNKMGPANLALIFTSVVFGDDLASLEFMDRSKDRVMETLIREGHILFNELSPDHATRSRSNSSSVHVARPRALLLSPSQVALAMEEASTSDTSSSSRQTLSQTDKPASPPDHTDPTDSVYSLYDRATAPGALDHSVVTPTAQIPPSSLPPSRSQRTAASPQLHQGVKPNRRQDSFDEPEPPLSAALGRRDPSA